jgi:O-antigen ligase
MNTTAAPTQIDSLQKVGFWGAVFVLFVAHSRVFEFVLLTYHIPAITLGLAIVLAILTGGLRRSLSNPIGICFLLLTFWMILGIPFAVWRGGAVRVLLDGWIRALPIYLIIVGLVVTSGQLRRMFYVMAYSVAILTVLVLAFGSTESGRLMLPGRGKFANPNDLAAILVIALPFWWFILTSARTSRVGRVFALPTMGVMLVVMLKTGSRGGMLGCLAVVAILFLSSPFVYKLQIAGAVLVLGVLAALFMPASLKERYFTVFEAGDETHQTEADSNLEQSAVSSAFARRETLMESIRVTLQHPLFGVGAGQFAVAEDELARARGQLKGSWAVTHNSYTQVSSETGIPGLLFYLGALVWCFKMVSACRLGGNRGSPEALDVAEMAGSLRLALVGFSVCAFFMSIAYQIYLPVLAGFVTALSSIHKDLQPTLARQATAAPPRTTVRRVASRFAPGDHVAGALRRP